MAEKSADKRKERVLTVGPDTKGIGGISSVLSCYCRTIPGITYLSTNSRFGTVPGAFEVLRTMLSLPFYRLAGYTVVHAHVAVGKSFIRKSAVLKWAQLLGYKTVYHNHGGAFRDYAHKVGEEKIMRFLHSCSAVAVLSESWRRYFVETLKCPHVYVVDNIVEEPARAVERRVLADDEVVAFAFLGKICEAKGMYDLLDALALRREYFEGRIKVLVAGNGEVNEFVKRVKEIGLESIVEYVGQVRGDDKDALLRRADVMLLPSYVEAMPIVLLEAGVYRMPSITTPVGGIPELIKNGENGVMVEPGNIEGLADAIALYVDEREMIYRQGAAAASAIVKNKPEAVAQTLEKLYESL